jgi:LmbE family N-acetylglucosaminyl deacetylase
MEEKDTISEIRRNETFECYQSLGIPPENIIWLGFPDCQLRMYQGRRPAKPGDKAVIEGFIGLQNAFTYWLRKINPTQCFVPTSTDLHPDHRIVHEELLISLYHATGNIWPELGTPIAKTPYIHEMGVYCDFPAPPQLQIKTPVSYLDKKVNGIAAFKSQRQITAVMEIIKNAGPVEYLRALDFKLYSPRQYSILFEEKASVNFPRR